MSVEAPAVRRFLRRGPDVGEIEARLAFRMRECQIQRTVGDLWQQRLLLRLRAAFRDQRCADHDGREIGLGDQAAPERFHQDADLDRAAAEPAMGLGDRQRQPAEIGELLPDIGAEAERIAGDLAAVIGGIGLADEAVGTFAQQPLLVAWGKVHLICFACSILLVPVSGRRDAGLRDPPPFRIPEGYARGRADAARTPARSPPAVPSRRPSD